MTQGVSHTMVEPRVEECKRQGDRGEHAEKSRDDAEDDVLAEQVEANGKTAWRGSEVK